MYNSLEVRCPFLDHRLIEFATTMPVDLKVNWFKGKYLLKKYCKKKIPNEIINRPKPGFTIPLAEMIRTELKPHVMSLLVDDFTMDFISKRYVKSYVSQHMDGKRDYSKQIWALLVLAIWYKQLNDC